MRLKNSVHEKVRFLADVAREHDCAIRVGVNCGSVAPDSKARHPGDDVAAMVASALEHCRMLDDLGFERYVVSLKDSHPRKVIEANVAFAAARPAVSGTGWPASTISMFWHATP